MCRTARQYVFDGMELLPGALTSFVERCLDERLIGHWRVEAAGEIRSLDTDRNGNLRWDQATLLVAIVRFWDQAFRFELEHAERTIAHELLNVRNRLSHNEKFSEDDAERALDSMRRLAEAAGAVAAAGQLAEMRDEILRSRFADPRRAGEPGFPAAAPHPPAQGRPPTRFTQRQFDDELWRTLDEAKEAGRQSCRVVSRDLHRRVVGTSGAHRMPMACNAMWRLFERLGRAGRVMHTTPSGRSSTIEIEYEIR